MARFPRAAVLVAACALVACTGETDPTPSPSPSISPSPTPTPERAMPLAFLVHPTRPPLDLTRPQAESILAGVAPRWRDVGERGGAIRLVFGPSAGLSHAGIAPSDEAAVATVLDDRDAMAIVSAEHSGVSVRTLTVAGTDPLTEPSSYPFSVPGPAPEPVLELLAVGDVMMGRRVDARLRARGDFAEPLRFVRRRLAAADVTVGTLESTLSRDGSPMQPPSENFAADPRVLPGLRRAGFDVLSLGNNHAGDFGARALVQTVRRMRDAGIRPVGAGEDERRARAPAIVTRDGVRFGFLAFNGREETRPATATTPGAFNVPMEPYARHDERVVRRLLDDVRALRRRADVVTVVPHWGLQYTHRQNAPQRRLARRIIDAGADMVIGSHPHWVQGVEIHRGRLIAYSLGNFVFDQRIQLPNTRRSVALSLTFWGKALKRVEFLPYRIGAEDYAPRFVSWRAGIDIIRDLMSESPPPYGSARR